LRIIAGEFKGKRLFSPKDRRVRPTTDKVKEAVFSMVSGYLEDAVVVDLFSGTGNLGLEALSRGARKCWFCDNSRDSMELVRRNIAHCGQEERSVTLTGDFSRALGRVTDKVDILFLDPPYGKGLIEKSLERACELSLLGQDGVAVAECGEGEDLPEAVSGMTKVKQKRYGAISVAIYAICMEEGI